VHRVVPETSFDSELHTPQVTRKLLWLTAKASKVVVERAFEYALEPMRLAVGSSAAVPVAVDERFYPNVLFETAFRLMWPGLLKYRPSCKRCPRMLDTDEVKADGKRSRSIRLGPFNDCSCHPKTPRGLGCSSARPVGRQFAEVLLRTS